MNFTKTHRWYCDIGAYCGARIPTIMPIDLPNVITSITHILDGVAQTTASHNNLRYTVTRTKYLPMKVCLLSALTSSG